MSYKKEHEAFVSGNEGTSTFHIAVTTIACFLPVFVRDIICIVVPTVYRKESIWLNLAFDFVVVIVPLQFIMSVLGQNSVYCLFSLCLFIALIFIMKIYHHQSLWQSVSFGNLKLENRRPFVTYYRAYANVLTAFCILAVDFKIFPRCFGKAEMYGTGLMDAGVGTFLISNSIVSPEARGNLSSKSIMSSFIKSVKSCTPLIVLGLIRTMSVKGLDYQEHVTEYGVHWNFFFTLAAVKIGCTLLFCAVSPHLWNVAGVVIIMFYQHGLTYGGLKDYIITGKDGQGGRIDLIDANREGLCSSIGYLCVYIMGVQLGKLIMKKREKMSDWFKLSVHLLIVSAVCWILLYFSITHVEPVSRRFTNLPYLLWMIAFNSLLLLIFLIFDLVVTSLSYLCWRAEQIDLKKMDEKCTDGTGYTTSDLHIDGTGYNTCDLLYAINYNGLFYFLFANVLTGLVNISLKTIYQSNVVAMVILTIYMFVSSTVTYILYIKNISLKVW